jgi:hypothetical protein
MLLLLFFFCCLCFSFSLAVAVTLVTVVTILLLPPLLLFLLSRGEVTKLGKEMDGLRKKIQNLENTKLTLEKDKVWVFIQRTKTILCRLLLCFVLVT